MVNISDFSSFFELIAGVNFGAVAILAFFRSELVDTVMPGLVDRISQTKQQVEVRKSERLALVSISHDTPIARTVFSIWKHKAQKLSDESIFKTYDRLNNVEYYNSLRRKYWPKFLCSALFSVLILIAGSLQQNANTTNNQVIVYHFIFCLTILSIGFQIVLMLFSGNYSMIRSSYLVGVTFICITIICFVCSFTNQKGNDICIDYHCSRYKQVALFGCSIMVTLIPISLLLIDILWQYGKLRTCEWVSTMIGSSIHKDKLENHLKKKG